MRHEFSNREPSVAPPKPPPKMTAKQLAAKMLSRAPPPITPSMAFDEEDETPNSGVNHARVLRCVLLLSLPSCQISGTWLTITKHTPQFITACVPGKPLPVFTNESSSFIPHPRTLPGGEPFSTPEQRADPIAMQQSAQLLRCNRAEGSGLPMKVHTSSFGTVICLCSLRCTTLLIQFCASEADVPAAPGCQASHPGHPPACLSVEKAHDVCTAGTA
jgi:hypothetical protein